MIKIFRVICLVLGTVLLIPTCLSLFVSLNDSGPTLSTIEIHSEEYAPEIASINSLHEFEDSIRLEIDTKGLSGIEIPILVDDYVRKKFYNEYSYIPWHDNWTLALIDKLFPSLYLTGHMKPNELIRFDYGICNQQAIVFQAIMKDLGFDYGSVRFSSPDFGHFTSAAKVSGDWYFFDPNLEPDYDRTDPEIFDQIISGNKMTLTRMYGDHFNNISSEMIQLGDINNFPASRGVLAQNMSFFLSWYGWIIFFALSLVFLWYGRSDSHTTARQPPRFISREDPFGGSP